MFFLFCFFGFSHERQAHSEAQRTIEQLKHALDETIFERDQLMKNITFTHKKVISRFMLYIKIKTSFVFPQVEKLENDISGYTKENRLLQQINQKLDKQLSILHGENEGLKQKEESCQGKVIIKLQKQNLNSYFVD